MAAAISLGLLALSVLASHQAYVNLDTYSHALAAVHAEEVVTIESRPYRVINGVVYRGQTPVTGLAALPALQLAYATMLARRDPLFAVPGVDPDQLRQSIAALARAQTQLATIQQDDASKGLAQRLYPIHFLQSLADLESARQTLLAEPTMAHARAYDQRLLQALQEKQGALRDFSQAFDVATKMSTGQIALFGGALSASTEASTLDALGNDLSLESATVRVRLRCLNGFASYCSDVPTPSFARTPALTPNASIAMAHEIQATWDAAFGNGPSQRSGALLAYSTCLPNNPTPRIMLATHRAYTGLVTSITYADDIYMYKLSTLRDPYATYMERTYGSQYTVMNPFQFYLCPQVGIDYGTAVAIVHIAAFAESHPALVPDARAKLMQEFPTEQDAGNYLAAVFDQSSGATIDERHALRELAVMLQERTGGLEDIVANIADVMLTDTSEPLRGSIDTQVSYEFLTHSAFPTFFRIGASADALLAGLYAPDPMAQEMLKRQLVTYTSLRPTVPHSTIVHDLRSFLITEGKLMASTTPSTTPPTTNTIYKAAP